MDREKHDRDYYMHLVYLSMAERRVLSDRQKRFFLDTKMANFWEKSGVFLNEAKQHLGIQYDPTSVIGTLVGCFFSPLEFYGQSGTSEKPSPSGAVVKKQNEVDELLRQAFKHTSKLLDIFEKIQDKSPYYPEEIDAIAVDGVEVSSASFLLKIQHAIAEYPETKNLFDHIQGLTKNRKDTWLDWFYQVNANLALMNRTHGGSFKLTVDDWAKIYIVLFKPDLDIQTAKETISDSIESTVKNSDH